MRRLLALFAVLFTLTGTAHAQEGVTIGSPPGACGPGTTCALSPPTNSSALTVTGASITGSSTVVPGISIAGTLNTSGTVDGVILFGNITNTSSPGATTLIDLQVGGVTQFNVTRTGTVTAAGSLRASNTSLIQWGTTRGMLSSSGAGVIQLGAADAAVPVAQTLSCQNVSAGTSNTAGAPCTFSGSAGTGTGAGGAFIFTTAPASTTGSTQNPQTTALTISSGQVSTFNGLVVLKGFTVSTLPASPAQGSMAFVTDAVACTFLAALTGGSTTYCPVTYNGTAWVGG